MTIDMPAPVDAGVAGYPWERPLGARPRDDGAVEFRVWAPRAKSVALRIGGEREVGLQGAGDGVYEVVVPAQPGDYYVYVLDGHPLPDPASRWQPHGIRRPSRVYDPDADADSPPAWDRFDAPAPRELVIYELHVGTFTPEGTFEAAIPYLRELAQLGITAVEIMPVAEFPGRRGWGYDGVYISAAQSSYGGPPALARFVRACHDAGLGVILDVVYNHVGASGAAALEAYGPYFTDKYETPWGRAMNYDDAGSGPVREWVLQSATGWIRDFGIDGLRLDAIHAIHDASSEPIVAAIARRVHQVDPRAVVIGEIGLADPDCCGAPACDGIWVDDFHHALHVLLTGEREGYYESFGTVGNLASALAHTPPERFVVYAQNHDQVGNRAFGDRLPEPVRPLAAFCTLLSPFVPLLFMGEEYGEPAPFQFFSDHIDEAIAEATRTGRREEFAAFASFASAPEEIPDPQDPATFERSKLTRMCDASLAGLYARLLEVRRRLPPGGVDAIEFDDDARWLRVRRGSFEVICNFATRSQRVPCAGATVELATHGAPALAAGWVELEPMSGALVA